MKTIETITFNELATRYCERQDSTPEQLLEVLRGQKQRYNPDGWFMLQCEMMDSSRMGELTILPYGPNNTFKTIPNHPVSPRGLASDMSCVVATMDASEIK